MLGERVAGWLSVRPNPGVQPNVTQL
jgi:hypothetical protein